MGGLIKTMPVTAVAFFLCAASVMGLPPLGGFFSKLMVVSGAVQYAGAGVHAARLWVPIVFVLGAFMTILYLLRAFYLIFLGDPVGAPAKEGSPVMVFSVALLAFLSLIGGCLLYFPSELAYSALRQMTGLIQ